MNKKEIYTTFYELYEIADNKDSGEDKNKSTIRRLISRHLQKEYPGKTWDKLSPLEQQRFTHIVMKQSFFDNYIQDPTKQKRIEKKIQKELNESFLDVNMRLKEQHERNEKIMKQYYVKKDSEQKKRKAYDQLCEDYAAIINKGTPQTYEEWTKTPLRLYDYIMSERLEAVQESIHEENSVPQKEINDTIIKTILKIFKSEFGIDINIQLITDCLTFLDNYEHGEFDELLIEYDPTLSISKEEQKEIISMNWQYQQYAKMLNELNFYTKKEKA